MIQSLSQAFGSLVSNTESVKDKVIESGALVIGAAGVGIQWAIPEFLGNDAWTFNHTVLFGVLMGVFVFEFLIGSTLAKRNVGRISSEMNDAFIRDSFILFICGASYFLGVAFGVHSYLFTFVTIAFIWANLYSLLANAVVLGWGKYFPMWLFNALEDEIRAKFDKYYPNKDTDEFIKQYKNENKVDHSELDEEFINKEGE